MDDTYHVCGWWEMDTKCGTKSRIAIYSQILYGSYDKYIKNFDRNTRRKEIMLALKQRRGVILK
jgi:hypothetical protein